MITLLCVTVSSVQARGREVKPQSDVTSSPQPLARSGFSSHRELSQSLRCLIFKCITITLRCRLSLSLINPFPSPFLCSFLLLILWISILCHVVKPMEIFGTCVVIIDSWREMCECRRFRKKKTTNLTVAL